MQSERCPYCDSDNRMERPGQPPHHAELVCGDCGRHLQWIGREIDREEAARFEMPYGKHRGTPMGELPKGYLVWLTETDHGRITERAKILLGPLPNQMELF